MAQVTLRDLLNQAMQFHQSGKRVEAEGVYRRILKAIPDEPNALHLYGLLCHETGRTSQAIQMLRRVVELRPAMAGFRSNLGQVLAAAGQIDDALSELRRAMELRPDSGEIVAHLANVLLMKGAVDEAIANAQQAIALLPGSALAHHHLGMALRAAGRLAEALPELRNAVSLAPDQAVMHTNLGNALQDADELEEAVAHFQQAIALQPAMAEAYNNLGTSLRMLGRLNDAMAKYRDAIALRPDYPMAHLNLGLTLLLQGKFEAGWRENEWRWRVPEQLPAVRYPGELWDGSDLAGKAILLHPEQGFGDGIQFVRYAPMVAARGGRVLLAIQPALRRLFEGIGGVERVMTSGDMTPPYQFRCPLMSLPLLFGTNDSKIPAPIPYLKADPVLVARWRERLSGMAGRKIGIAWAGRAEHLQDRHRSITLEMLAALAQVPDVQYISLQTGAPALQAKKPSAFTNLLDWTSDLTDFAETAALIESLDLVITVDTAVAHLAGAMGKPVWNLIAYVPDWRWLLHREDTPWYPTMRLFRQPSRGDWTTPIQRVASALRAELDQRP